MYFDNVVWLRERDEGDRKGPHISTAAGALFWHYGTTPLYEKGTRATARVPTHRSLRPRPYHDYDEGMSRVHCKGGGWDDVGWGPLRSPWGFIHCEAVLRPQNVHSVGMTWGGDPCGRPGAYTRIRGNSSMFHYRTCISVTFAYARKT